MIEKARAVASRVGALSQDFAGAHRLAHQAQVREALTRTELTVALHESLIARAEAQARLREHALSAYRAGAGLPLRRRNRITRRLERLAARLGARGQARVIARSGVWRGGDLDEMEAYAARGADPTASPAACFDQAWYLAEYPGVVRPGLAPLVHFLVAGGQEGRAPGPLFDDVRYRAAHAADLAATGLTTLEHYARAGAASGFSPHSMFDMAHYLGQSPGLAPGEDPLGHYMREGSRLGLSPHPLFDPAWYAEQAGDLGGTSALGHYLTVGWRQGLSPHPLFDAAFYADGWPDVAESGLPPLQHFALIGGFELRSPSPWFDLEHYLDKRNVAAGVNPLVDYLQGGAWAVAEAREGFPTAAYLASRPELVRAGVTPLEHWARRGGH